MSTPYLVPATSAPDPSYLPAQSGWTVQGPGDGGNLGTVTGVPED